MEKISGAVRDRREHGWFHTDNEIIDFFGPDLGAYGLALYSILSREAVRRHQRIHISLRDLGALAKVSPARVMKSLQLMVKLHLIQWEVPRVPAPGLASIITLLNVKDAAHLARTGKKRRPENRSRSEQVQENRSPHEQVSMELFARRTDNKEVRRESTKTGIHKSSRAAREAQNLTPATPAGALMARWLSIKKELQEQIPEAEARRWLRPLFLLKVMAGDQLLLALPPNARIQAEALARKELIKHAAQWAGFKGVSFTKYPDDWELEQLEQRFPEYAAQFFGSKKRAARLARQDQAGRAGNGGQ